MRKNRYPAFKVLILVLSFFTVLCGFAGPSRADSSVAGSWNLNANNYKGVMEISGNPGSYHGRFKYDAHGNWEDMLDLRVQGNSISFRRAHADQRYKGAINNNRISGTFNQGGAGSYQWVAVKAGGGGGSGASAPPEAVFAGSWSLNSNNYTGVMEIGGSQGSFHGRFKYDAHGQWEEMQDLRLQGNSISFRRAHADQRYKGSLNGSTITGNFNQGGAGSYQWKAVKK